MSISHAEVAKVAALARLALSGPEIDAMARDMANVLGYIDQLSEVADDAVEPMGHPSGLCNVTREDDVRASLARPDALANAAQHDGKSYLAPAVLDT